MALYPRPISTVEYHDQFLVGISLSRSSQQVSLAVEDDQGRRTAVHLHGVVHLSVRDLLAGNIIDIIECHRIDGPEVVAEVARAFLSHRSQYYPERVTQHPSFATQVSGKLFLQVSSSYGVDLLAVANAVTEEPAIPTLS